MAHTHICTCSAHLQILAHNPSLWRRHHCLLILEQRHKRLKLIKEYFTGSVRLCSLSLYHLDLKLKPVVQWLKNLSIAFNEVPEVRSLQKQIIFAIYSIETRFIQLIGSGCESISGCSLQLGPADLCLACFDQICDNIFLVKQGSFLFNDGSGLEKAAHHIEFD